MAKKKGKRKPNVAYDLLPYSGQTDKRILAFDPGSRNMGIALVAKKGKNLGVIANSVMTNPVNDLTMVNAPKQKFIDEVGRWVDEYKPQGIIAERFQTRGLGGPLIEQVSFMLGLLAGHFGLPIKLITASTWKNKFQRRFDIDLKEDVYKEIKIQPHQLDACLIGCYGLEFALDQEFVYTPESIIDMAELRSCIPHIRGR